MKNVSLAFAAEVTKQTHHFREIPGQRPGSVVCESRHVVDYRREADAAQGPIVLIGLQKSLDVHETNVLHASEFRIGAQITTAELSSEEREIRSCGVATRWVSNR